MPLSPEVQNDRQQGSLFRQSRTQQQGQPQGSLGGGFMIPVEERIPPEPASARPPAPAPATPPPADAPALAPSPPLPQGKESRPFVTNRDTRNPYGYVPTTATFLARRLFHEDELRSPRVGGRTLQ